MADGNLTGKGYRAQAAHDNNVYQSNNENVKVIRLFDE